MHSINDKEQREVASLTKIMTCLTVLTLTKEYGLDDKNLYFITSEHSASVGGTTAGLDPGDEMNIHDLLYGLMLPSGNDAAMTLAQNFHKLIIDREKIAYGRLKSDIESNQNYDSVNCN